MLSFLVQKRQKAIAWFLLVIFYSEMAGSAYASRNNSVWHTPVNYTMGTPDPFINTSEPPQIKVTKIGGATVNKSPKALANEKKFLSPPQAPTQDQPGPSKNEEPEKTNIGGPGQPEMSTFKSVGSDNMVNLFTGDFSYNIPLLDVDGYPVNIFYNAGATMDQEASWVGLGWNINPGTISRNMRGIPDDFKGSDGITKVQSMRPEWTVGINGGKDKEIVGVPTKDNTGITKKSFSIGASYNNKRGIGLELGLSGQFTAQKKIAEKMKTEKGGDTTVNYFINSSSLNGGVTLSSQNGLTPSIGFTKYLWDKDHKNSLGLSTSVDFNSRTGLSDISLSAETRTYENFINKKGKYDRGSLSSDQIFSTSIGYGRASTTPSIRMPITTFNASFSAKFGREKDGIAKTLFVNGYYSRAAIREKYQTQQKKAYGYMYSEHANGDKNAVLDFNRLNDGTVNKKTPVVSVPVYTSDVFSISGEGTGGTFRGYRGNMGYVKDNYVRTNPGKFNLALEFSGGKLVKTGSTFGGVYSATIIGGWESQNILKNVAEFKANDKMEQKGFYFKNPGEKAIIDEDYYNAMGQDKLMRPMLATSLNLNITPPFLQPTVNLINKFQTYDNLKKENGIIDITRNNGYRKHRDKRTQVISYLTAEEADRVGLERYIYSFKENVFKPGSCTIDPAYKTIIRRYSPDGSGVTYRKAHHISEITVQQGPQRYIYGIPVYQLEQKEVSFSVDFTKTVDENNGLVSYAAGEDNSIKNKQGKDWNYQSETVSPYAHSFLLTSILSPDYSDLTGDGITDDDLGTAIKFNYTRVNQRTSFPFPNSWPEYRWRSPIGVFDPAKPGEAQANFNRGLVTDNSDNQALYTYGAKELWYTHSIESKNMIATFTLSNRQDGYGVRDTNGVIRTGANVARQKKLDRIDLYSKADFVKYGVEAKPIKSVFFTYSYKLCKNYPLFSGNASQGNGKLTLQSIHFTYRGNNHVKNRYKFKYAGEDDNAIVYNPKEQDRWGNYKPHQNNPGGANPVSNEDYPYATQNKTQADANAAIWNLSQILLPSGARMDINYESDDYAYVQDRRAAQMVSILGFGATPLSTPENKLFKNSGAGWFPTPWNFTNVDHRYVFFNAPVPVSSREDIKNLYLKDLKQLLLKLWVKVPTDSYGGGFEPMFVYATFGPNDYNVVPNSGGTRFYIRIGKGTKHNASQIMETVYQFLRDHLPSKAYPGYDVGNKTGVGQLVKSMAAMVNNIRTGVTGFENNARWDGWCKEVDLTRSAARLSCPTLNKLGGGHRVKSVVILDNWKKMTNPNSPTDIDSYYGQVYDYTNNELVNGVPQTISSGVAGYEPGIGNEENPFREVLVYNAATTVLGPTANGNVELPVAEMFYPSAFVGYSKVSVKSIHNKTNANPALNKNIKSGVGMSVTEFFTTREFPTVSQFTDFDRASRHHYAPNPINKVFRFGQKDYTSLSQGFIVRQNDMNGKVKMQASYAENDLKNPISKNTNYYRMTPIGENKYQLNNTLPVISGPDGKITNKLVGKDIEIMNDFREHFTFTHSAQVPVNLDIFNAGSFPVILPTIFRAVFRDERLYRAATTLKVVNEFGILDSVEVIDKGSRISTQNLVYDAESGEALITRTQNEFNKPIYNFSYPAYWANEGMGPAYKNIDALYNKVIFRNGKIESGIPEDQINNIFQSGDEIYVVDHATIGPPENPACVLGGYGQPCTPLPVSSEFRIWAVDITKDLRNTTKEFIFVDRKGNPYHAADASIRIIRSGRRNMTDAAVGSVVSMNSPIIKNGAGDEHVFISDASNVVNSGAIEFKEKWKTQDAYYYRDTVLTETRYTRIKKAFLPARLNKSYSIAKYRADCRTCTYVGNYISNPQYFFARKQSFGPSPAHSKRENKSWLTFDISSLPSPNVEIHSASLTFNAHFGTPPHIFSYRRANSSIFDGGRHGNNDAHYRNADNISNMFILERMQAQWPVNQGQWDAQYNAWSTNVNDKVYVPGPVSRRGETANSNSVPNVDIKPMLKLMIRDYFDPVRQYEPAIRVSMYDASDNKHDTRVCFALDKFKDVTPTITARYSDCNDLLPPGYVPQPGDELTTCLTSVPTKLCFSVFTKQYMNPYVQGLLGNWRPDRSHVFYGERREQDPTVATTSISKDGIIKDFETFWNLDPANKQLTKSGSAKWVWNSRITQYNRKGAELENLDPLGRYNAGIYGYNEALPVAVVNNSKLRLSAYDGFEDYYFKDQSCNLACDPNKRHFDTKIDVNKLDNTQAHTGIYSLKTAGGASSTIPIKISLETESPPTDPDIYIPISRTTQNVQTVVLQGAGVQGNYRNCTVWFTTCGGFKPPVANDMIDVNNNLSAHCPGINKRWVQVQWNGQLQVQQSGVYDFSFMVVNNSADIWVNGIKVHEQILERTPTVHIPISLTVGIMNTITVNYSQRDGSALINLAWKKPCDLVKSPVPRENLYMPGVAGGPITTTPIICTKVNQIKALSNYLIDEFNLVSGKKMVASVWVKKGTGDCRCPGYTGFTISLKDANGNTIPNGTFAPKGNIIEGWQLFEAIFDVPPPTGGKMDFVVNNTSGGEAVYIDDLRFHPFNANMQSYVYSPYTLKPVAELDANNYATFYEYDDDGTLIRVKKETRLGIKTIQESRSSLQKTVTDF